jgi:glycosyltransferase involved in cell wall biosynthesis
MSNIQHDYIFFADDRGGIPTSTMHLADQIAKTHRVFWVNIYTRLPKISIHEFSRAFRILTNRSHKAAPQQCTESGSSIISATPMQFPWFTPPVRKLNGFLGGRFFRHFVKKHNIQSPVLITNFPCVVDTFKSIRKSFPDVPQVYYCFDDFIEYPGFNPQHWRAMENEFFNTVNGAVFTSRDLVQKKHRDALPDLYLPHGVDYEHFTPNNTVKIEQLESLPKPVVGFFGGLSPSWFDLDIFVYLAKRFPLYSFVVIGPSESSTEVLSGIANLHYLGAVPYSELPQYARCFDVGLMPFVKNKLTQAANPLKLYEYYAAGLPIISTNLPFAADAPGPLYLADTKEEFGNHLETILGSDLEAAHRLAREVAKQNSWSARAEELMKFIETIE